MSAASIKPDEVALAASFRGVSRIGPLVKALAPWVGCLGVGCGLGGAVATKLITNQPPAAIETSMVTQVEAERIADRAAARAIAGMEARLSRQEDRIASIEGSIVSQQRALEAFDSIYKAQMIQFSKDMGDVKSTVGNVKGSIDTLVAMLKKGGGA